MTYKHIITSINKMQNVGRTLPVDTISVSMLYPLLSLSHPLLHPNTQNLKKKNIQSYRHVYK